MYVVELAILPQVFRQLYCRAQALIRKNRASAPAIVRTKQWTRSLAEAIVLQGVPHRRRYKCRKVDSWHRPRKQLRPGVQFFSASKEHEW